MPPQRWTLVGRARRRGTPFLQELCRGEITPRTLVEARRNLKQVAKPIGWFTSRVTFVLPTRTLAARAVVRKGGDALGPNNDTTLWPVGEGEDDWEEEARMYNQTILDEDLVGKLQLEALYQQRTPKLALQLKFRARQLLQDKVRACTSQQWTAIIAKAVNHAMLAQPAELVLFSNMAKRVETYRRGCVSSFVKGSVYRPWTLSGIIGAAVRAITPYTHLSLA